MKVLHSFLLCIMFANFSFAQRPKEYQIAVGKADSLYQVKEYLASANMYSTAFKANGWKGSSTDRYNAGCSWALAGIPDSAFFQLEKVAKFMNYVDYDHVLNDSDLNSLHEDKRWLPFITLVKQNKEKKEANLNKPLMMQLDIIWEADQKYRQQIKEIEVKYGANSAEIQEHWKKIHITDSINLIKVMEILDKYGWLGEDVIGSKGNSALFLVIQHSDLTTQQKYLPMMREAVKNKKAAPPNLALLEDRVALREGRKQIYGSQIGTNPVTNALYVLPLEDPDNVDKKRAGVGLEPLDDYLKYWNLTWDVEKYKKDLLMIESLQKK